MSVIVRSSEQMRDLGMRLAQQCQAGDVIVLIGDLGAGKTTLVQGMGIGLGISEPVTSPTFALIQEYPAPRGRVVHADLYRVRSPAELDALGWHELVDQAPLLLVEWPEVAAGTFPRATLHLRLAHDPADPERRLLTVTPGAGGVP